MSDEARRGFYLGRYNCFDRIGADPLGETFRAKIYGVAGFEKGLAVKRLHANLCADEEFVARFVNAATAYAGLDHERIAKVHEVNVQGAQYYVAVDLVKGLDLGHLLDSLSTRGEALARDAAMVIALDAAEALGYAHARRDLLPNGVLHLGLSPSTVVITNDGEVRLLDVGLNGALVRLGWADDDTLLPSLAYLPPEQFRADPLDTRADVFALGALLHELLGGRRAFPGDSAREVRSRIEATPPTPPAADARLQALIIHMLQAEPDARVTSMDAVREALVPLLGSRTARARADLGQLVRRLTRPHLKTGTFAAVAVPSLGPSAPPPPPIAVESKPWQPPKTNTLPTVKLPPPPPPHGPELSPVPPRNTFAGLGADDQALVLELVDQLPGHPTERAIPVVTPEELARHKPSKAEHEAVTAPFEKLPDNGAGSGMYELYSVGDSSPTLPSLRNDGTPKISDVPPVDDPVTDELMSPAARPQDETITAPVDKVTAPVEKIEPPAHLVEADRTLTPKIPTPAVPPKSPITTLKGRPAPPLPPGVVPVPPVSPSLLPKFPTPPPAPAPVVPPEQPTFSLHAPTGRPMPVVPAERPTINLDTPTPAPGSVSVVIPTATPEAATMHLEAPTIPAPQAPMPEQRSAPLPALVPEAAPPPVRATSTAPMPTLALPQRQTPSSSSRGILIALMLAVLLVGGGAALYFFVFQQRPTDGEEVKPPVVATPNPETNAPVAIAPKPEETTPPKPVAVAPKPEEVKTPKPEEVKTPKPVAVAPKPEEVKTPKPEEVKTPKPEEVKTPKPVAVAPKPVAPEEMAPGARALEIISSPPGAALFVDGKPRGVTPVNVGIEAGEHKVVLLADGFKMLQKSVREPGKLELTLEPAKLPADVAGEGGLKVRCKNNGELRIFVDGHDSGRTCPNDVRISVTPGTHKISLHSARTGQVHEMEKEIAEGSNSTRVYTTY